MEDGDCEYQLFDRHGKFFKRIDYPICLRNLPRVKYFGFCPIESTDVTLEFATPIDSRKIINNSDN